MGKIWILLELDLAAYIQMPSANPPTTIRIQMPNTALTTTISMSPIHNFDGVKLGIILISILNPYQNHWAIELRAISKGNLRTYDNEKGNSKVFLQK